MRSSKEDMPLKRIRISLAYLHLKKSSVAGGRQGEVLLTSHVHFEKQQQRTLAG